MKGLKFSIALMMIAAIGCSRSGGSHRGGAVAGSILDVQPSVGTVAGGTSVLITTQGLADFQLMAPTVTFDGNAATFVQAPAADMVEVLTPTASGTGWVDVVVTEGAVSATRPMGFEYVTVPPPLPCTFGSACPDRGLLAGGEIVMILGVDFENLPRVFFDGVESPNVQFVSTTEITAEAPGAAAAGLVDIQVDNPSGGICVGTAAYEYLASSPIMDNQEPNDTLISCFAGVPTTLGVFYDGTFHTGTDEDWYCFTALGGPRVVTMNPDPITDPNYDLELYDASGALIMGSYSVFGQEMLTTPGGGTFSVRVINRCGEVGEYTISFG
ncbi:MAG: IPT/TIG domain-containing protein [Planctomycetota bacterium]|nr:IPT/TIG domain-containing protein [Planctomycetota bacterium]